jgi:hypothetical protein
VRRRLALLLVLTGALVVPASARAESGPSWAGIANRITASMEALQRPDGSLTDYLSPTAQPYAEAMVGYGLLLHGLRRNDRRATEAGLLAIGQTVQPGIRGGPRLDSVFKQLAVASAYRLAMARLAGDAGRSGRSTSPRSPGARATSTWSRRWPISSWCSAACAAARPAR